MMMADNYKSDMSDLLCTGSDRDRLKTADVVRLGSSGDPWESFTKKQFADFDGFWEGYKQGITLRKVESAVNDDSSRSHLCICFEVTRREIDTYGTTVRYLYALRCVSLRGERTTAVPLCLPPLLPRTYGRTHSNLPSPPSVPSPSPSPSRSRARAFRK